LECGRAHRLSRKGTDWRRCSDDGRRLKNERASDMGKIRHSATFKHPDAEDDDMRVDIHEEGGESLFDVSLREAMGDDDQAFQLVKAELLAKGSTQFGGGAAPLYRLDRVMPAEDGFHPG
jgi:hypothetical protein